MSSGPLMPDLDTLQSQWSFDDLERSQSDLGDVVELQGQLGNEAMSTLLDDGGEPSAGAEPSGLVSGEQPMWSEAPTGGGEAPPVAGAPEELVSGGEPLWSEPADEGSAISGVEPGDALMSGGGGELTPVSLGGGEPALVSGGGGAEPAPVSGGPTVEPAEEPVLEVPEPSETTLEDTGASELSTSDVVLIDEELAEHARWGAALGEVGEAASPERAEFVANAVSSGMGDAAVQGAGMAVLITGGTKLAGRYAGKFVPIPAVGAIIGGVMAGAGLWDTYQNWDAPGGGGESLSNIGAGASGYEVAANTIQGIVTILDLAANILDVIGGIAGVVAAACGVAILASLGTLFPALGPIAATATKIALTISVVTGIMNIIKMALQPLVMLFRALHTFYSEADPRDVEAQGAALTRAGAELGGTVGGLAGGMATEHAAGRMGDPPDAGRHLDDVDPSPPRDRGPEVEVDPSTGPRAAADVEGPGTLHLDDVEGAPRLELDVQGGPRPATEVEGTPTTGRPEEPLFDSDIGGDVDAAFDAIRMPEPAPAPTAGPSAPMTRREARAYGNRQAATGRAELRQRALETGDPLLAAALADPAVQMGHTAAARHVPESGITRQHWDEQGFQLLHSERHPDLDVTITNPDGTTTTTTRHRTQDYHMMDPAIDRTRAAQGSLTPEGQMEVGRYLEWQGENIPLDQLNVERLRQGGLAAPEPGPAVDPTTGRVITEGSAPPAATAAAQPDGPVRGEEIWGELTTELALGPESPASNPQMTIDQLRQQYGAEGRLGELNWDPTLSPPPEHNVVDLPAATGALPDLDLSGTAPRGPVPEHNMIDLPEATGPLPELDLSGTAPPSRTPEHNVIDLPEGSGRPPLLDMPEADPRLLSAETRAFYTEMESRGAEFHQGGSMSRMADRAETVGLGATTSAAKTLASAYNTATASQPPGTVTGSGLLGGAYGQVEGPEGSSTEDVAELRAEAEVNVEPVNPAYPEPPGSEADLARLENDMEAVLAERAQAEADAREMEASAECAERNQTTAEQVVGRTSSVAGPAAQAHAGLIARREQRNQEQQQRLQQSEQQTANAAEEVAGTGTLLTLLGIWSGFTGLMSYLPGSAGRKFEEMNEEANTFIEKLAEVKGLIESEAAAGQPRLGESEANAERISATGAENEATRSALDQAEQDAASVASQQGEMASEAQETADQFQQEADEAETLVGDMASEHETLAEQLQAWAEEHKAARALAVEETVLGLEDEGYTVTGYCDW